MEFAADFTAVDFETASRRADSACQLAAVKVREGRIVESSMWMIRPEPFVFARANIRIHGITPEQVRDKPDFAEQWPEIEATLADDCLVAHNASFDIGVLLACFRTHQISIPELQFTCTRAIARRTWPHHRRYGLKPLADWLGIRFRHHDALEDSLACAKILLAAGIDREASTLDDLEKRLKLRRGQAGAWGQTGPTGRTRRRGSRNSGTSPSTSGLPFLFPDDIRLNDTTNLVSDAPHVDLQRLMIRAEFIRPLSGKHVVFAGRLRTLDLDDARRLAARLGGTWQDSVDDAIDVLVLGSSARGDQATQQQDQQSKAEALAERGKPIRIVAEDEFLGLIISQS